MSVATWHPGKLAMLWLGAVALCWVGIGLDYPPPFLADLILGAVAVVTTWKWFSAHERPPTAAQGGDFELPGDADSPAKRLATTLFGIAIGAAAAELPGVEAEAIAALPEDRVKWEKLCLAAFGVDYGTYVAFEGEDPERSYALDIFYSYMRGLASTSRTPDEDLAILTRRMDEYADAARVGHGLGGGQFLIQIGRVFRTALGGHGIAFGAAGAIIFGTAYKQSMECVKSLQNS